MPLPINTRFQNTLKHRLDFLTAWHHRRRGHDRAYRDRGRTAGKAQVAPAIQEINLPGWHAAILKQRERGVFSWFRCKRRKASEVFQKATTFGQRRGRGCSPLLIYFVESEATGSAISAGLVISFPVMMALRIWLNRSVMVLGVCGIKTVLV